MKLFPFLRRSGAVTAPASIDAPRRKRSYFMGNPLGGMFKASAVTERDKWSSFPVSPDQFISLRQPVLVARSREQWSNNDYVKGFIRRVRQNIVGRHGITMHARVKLPRGKLDTDTNAAIDSAWKDWGATGNCDVTGTMTWRQLQVLAIETAARDGEFIFREIYGDDAGPYGYALQAIDPQRLPVSYENSQYGKDGSFIRHGIEFNKYGRPVAYHFSSTDEWDANYYLIAGRGFVRVPAEQIIHGFVKEMVGQRRGIPWASTALFRLHHLAGFEDAAVQNARAGASQMGFIQWEAGFGPECEEGDDVAGSIDAEPLSFHELPEGAKLAEFKPQYPNGEFERFHKAMLRGAATGMGTAYNPIANDLEGVNYSSIRQGALDERDNWMECQQWLVEVLCERVHSSWFKVQLLRQSIVAKGKPLDAAALVRLSPRHWQPRRWDWIDPKSDVTANVTAVRGGFKSISEVIRERGRDPAEVFAEIADDYEQMVAAKLPEDFINVIFGILPAPEPAPSKADESVAKEPK
ncbi:phage portal protein [Tardiphaga sp. 20_F10_N6_6]|uniref:phage portal protein n=1 Tax=Tardiphaga sp. 20_F10_N6_6 TaxID=3240788 RepID=UPI003F8A7485